MSAYGGHPEEHGGHHELPFWKKYIFSVDHKVIGLQYMFTALFFLLVGLSMILLIRWQLAFPGQPIPVLGAILPETMVADGVMLPEFYNQLATMHGTIMVFLGIVPLGVGAFGNFVLPLQIGARDMAFPIMNATSYWVYLAGAIINMLGFLVAGGAPQSGWTSYAPLSVINPASQNLWLIGMLFLIASSLLGAINFIVTTIKMRAPGMTFGRLPIFCWAQFVTSFLLLLAFPTLEVACFFELLDRMLGTSFFMPSGLVVSGAPMSRSGGGQPLLWQHLFWFLGHPEVYVLIVPGMGIVAEIVATFTRKAITGYRAIVYSFCTIGCLSFIVWAHHMFQSGMSAPLGMFFATTTMIISVPSIIILTCLTLSLWGGSIKFTTPMLFAVAFMPLFGIGGGLTGLPLGDAPTDIYLHDTYYVIAHFHYVVVTGSIFALFAGLYYWFPKMFGRKLNETLGKIHFWGFLVTVNGVFLPMFVLGVAGMSRRLYDPTVYAHTQPVQYLNQIISVSAWCLLLAQIPFIVNVFHTLRRGEKVTEKNPWKGTTLEWDAPTPPPHGNFGPVIPTVHRGPYEHDGSREGDDFVPQTAPSR